MVLLWVIFVLHLTTCYGLSDGHGCCKDFGIKVPNKKCLLPWDVFKSTIAGVTWISVYAAATETVNTPGLKVSARWEILEDGSVRRLVSNWDVEGNKCFHANNTYGRSGGECTNTAKIEVQIEQHPQWFRLSRTDRFVSRSPDEFLILSFCHNDDDKCQGYCSKSVTMVFIKDQRVDSDGDGYPDGDIILQKVPWCLIEKTLNECLDATIGDNSTANTLLTYQWRGDYECRIGDK